MLSSQYNASLLVSFPKEQLPRSLSAGAICTIVLLSLIFATSVMGIIVEMTPLGNKEDIIDGGTNHPPVHKRKEKWALFFLSFSFTYNMKKLCTIADTD